ncbi:pentatricopeptide repeat-containing protein At3g60980, mitochondrial [Capsella rubella]|uniref:pentatricopeptide repeat-containing protein At3g60980, mitochondrial n=1 Tax=Capsella rubella TaxID=81985 RepID=UPI000CD56F2B|nr:pentatricopeptide repeat-containing protein At3g60980, mitochondrial [Capsella rubella]
MSLIRRLNLGRRFCTAVPRRAEDIMSNPDCRPKQLCLRVWYLIRFVGDLDTAAKYARLAVYSRRNSEFTTTTCQFIIEGMLRDERCEEAADLHYFLFNKHKLRPNVHCANSIFKSSLKIQRGFFTFDRVFNLHKEAVKSVKLYDYPSTDSFRVMTKGLVHSGRLDLAKAVLEDKTVDRIIYPDHVAFNNLIRGFLGLGNLDEANRLLLEFKRLFYNALSVTKDDLHHSNFENRVAFLTATFMEYWFKQGRFSEAMETYKEARAKNHFLSDKYTITKCCEKGADSLFFDVDGYIITRCCENGMLSEAESVFVDSLAVDLGYIDTITFKTMIDAYVKAGRIDDAIKTSNKMIDATLKEVSDLF